MPALVAWLVGVLETSAGSIIVSALLSLGISMVSYTFAVGPVEALVQQQAAGIPGQFLAVLGWLKIDIGLTMIFSAFAARWAVQGSLHFIRTKK